MAFRTVELDESEVVGLPFKSFAAIGDRHHGVFLRTVESTANYADGPKKVTKYIFKNPEGEYEITPPTDLRKRLEKAELRPGFKVIMEFTHTRPIAGKADPMKVFTVKVDDSTAAAPAKTAPAKPAADDDIPF